MIKLFRHIRKSLIEQNKMGKYFKYAIGEIILVVIGILIALQINNWNESRIKSNKEATVLVNIHKEFKNNKKQLDSVIKLHEQTYNACSKIISHFPIKSKPNQTVLDSLSVYLWNSYGGITFNPSQSSIDALTNTSSFDVIKNDQLRDLLISWKDLITDYQEEELSSKAYGAGKFDTFMSKYFDFNYNFKDTRNNFKALQTLEFEFLIKTQHDLVNQILHSSGELQKVQETLDSIIELSKPNRN